MRVPKLIVLIAIFGFAPSFTHAGWFDINISGSSATAELGAHFGNDPQGRFGLGVRGLYNNDRDTTLGTVIARWDAESDAVPGLSFLIGVEAMAGTEDELDVGAAAVAIESDFGPPKWKGAYVGAGLAYAPDIFTWSDTETAYWWSVRAGYRINPKARIYLEYEQLRVDFVDIGRRTLDDGIKGGFGVRF